MDKQIENELTLQILKSILDGRKRINDAKVKECLLENKHLIEQYTKLAERMAKEQELENAETNYDHAYSDVYNV